jgi:hypothetical protein
MTAMRLPSCDMSAIVLHSHIASAVALHDCDMTTAMPHDCDALAITPHDRGMSTITLHDHNMTPASVSLLYTTYCCAPALCNWWYWQSVAYVELLYIYNSENIVIESYWL